MHFDLANHPPEDTIKLLAPLLEKLARANDRPHYHVTDTVPSIIQKPRSRSQSFSKSTPYTCFHAKTIPSISIQAYLIRIQKYCPCRSECFLALLVYFDRLAKTHDAHPPFRIDSFNIHRLIIAGVVVTSKLFSDLFYTNTRYAKVGGLPVSELNVLELEFLNLNRYEMFITVAELQHYSDQLLLHRQQEHERNAHGSQLNVPTPPPKMNNETDPMRAQTKARQLSIDSKERAELASTQNIDKEKQSHTESTEKPANVSIEAAKRQGMDPLPTPPGMSPPCDQVFVPLLPSSSHESRSF